MHWIMLEPRSLTVDIHRVTFVVFSCKDIRTIRSPINFHFSLVRFHRKIFTQHLVPRCVNSCNAKRWICVCGVSIYRKFPIMYATRESDWSECDTIIPTVSGHSVITVREVQQGADFRIECEPGNCFVYEEMKFLLMIHMNLQQYFLPSDVCSTIISE